MRRWVDAGQVKLSRTSGGHRRIPLTEAVRFIRQSRPTLIRPDLLGLGETAIIPAAVPGGRDDADEAERLYQALAGGDRVLSRGIIVSWYLSGRSPAALFDGPLRGAMNRVGELWRHDDAGILIEHGATEIIIDTLAHLRSLVPPASADSPVAIGGAPSGEFYAIPSAAAAIVLAEAGFRDINYGPNTPPLLLAAAAEQHGARLLWVSISTTDREAALERQLRALARRIEPRGAKLVIGGRHAGAHVPRDAANVVELASMTELSAFACGLTATMRAAAAAATAATAATGNATGRAGGEARQQRQREQRRGRRGRA